MKKMATKVLVGLDAEDRKSTGRTLWQASLGVLIDDASLNWLILPDALKTGYEAENEARVAGERVTLPDRGKKQERSKPAG